MIDIEKVLWLRSEGRSLRSIGRELGCSHVSVLKRLRKMGLVGKTVRGGNPEFLKNVSHARLEGNNVPEKTPPYFIKEGTDEIFGYTRFLAERADMKPFYGTLEDFKKGLNGKSQSLKVEEGKELPK